MVVAEIAPIPVASGAGSFVSGSECEYQADAGSWHPAVVSVCRDGPTFDVTFFQDGQMDVAERVAADRLRLSAPAPATAPATADVPAEVEGKTQQEQEQEQQAEEVPTTTGLGGWQTVSTRTVDEEEDQREAADRKRKHEAELRIRTRNPDEHSNSVIDHIPKEQREQKAAVYKGIDMAAPTSDDINRELSSIAGGAKVAFKNRKGARSGVSSTPATTAATTTTAMTAITATSDATGVLKVKAEHIQKEEVKLKAEPSAPNLSPVQEVTPAAAAVPVPVPLPVPVPVPVPAVESAKPVVITMKSKKRAFRAVALGGDCD